MFVTRLISFFTAFCLLAGQPTGLLAESFQVAFRVGNSAVDTSYSYNARACTRMLSSLSAVSNAKISITSYSSPDGKSSRNRQLSRLRAYSVRDFILSGLPSLEPSQVEIRSVDEDWEGVVSYLNRSSFEWKQEALDIIQSSSGDKKALLQDLWVGEAWDDLVKNCFPSLRRVSVCVHIDAPVAVSNDDSASIIFNRGSSSVSSSSYSALRQMASSGASTLYIYIKASPEGTEEGNRSLSTKRSSRIESLLRSYGFAGSVRVEYLGEDWQGLLAAVKAADYLPDKEAVIDILQNDGLDRDSRKKALQSLSYGHTWLRLMETEMKLLRKATVSTNPIQQ